MEPSAAEARRTEWRVAGASVCGTSHQKANLPCQDVLQWRLQRDGLLLAALADGAGSAAFAEVGADIAARSALESLAASFGEAARPASDVDWRAALREALQRARSAVLAEAARRQVRPRELASTLLLAAFAATRVGAAQIGDGAVVIARPGENPCLLTKPAISEYLNETTFLTADSALDQPQIAVEESTVQHVAMFCDGLQLLALKLPEATPHPGFFLPLFRFVDAAMEPSSAGEQLRAFLQSPRITARADDDLSLLLASRPVPQAPVAAPGRP